MVMQVFTYGSWNLGTNCMRCAAVVLDVTGQWISGISVSYGHENAFFSRAFGSGSKFEAWLRLGASKQCVLF